MQLSKQEMMLLCNIAHGAGERLMPYFRAQNLVTHKPDRSPVSEADVAAHDYMASELEKNFPGILVVSEEGELPATPETAPYFLVDPLDGTRGFLRGEEAFCVCLGLAAQGNPLFGVLYHPPSDTLYHGGSGYGAFRGEEPIITRPMPPRPRVARSSSYMSKKSDAFLATLPPHDTHTLASAMKFALLAEGRADCYPRFGPTMEWDTCAGHAILLGAGGRVEVPEGGELVYGKPGYANGAFIAWGSPPHPKTPPPG